VVVLYFPTKRMKAEIIINVTGEKGSSGSKIVLEDCHREKAIDIILPTIAVATQNKAVPILSQTLVSR